MSPFRTLHRPLPLALALAVALTACSKAPEAEPAKTDAAAPTAASEPAAPAAPIDPMAVVKPTGEAAAQSPQQYKDMARSLLAELVAIDTTQSKGNTLLASQAMAKHFLAAGFPASDVHVVADDRNPTRGNLVVKLAGSAPQLKPALLLAHIDVVEADAKDWTLPPFELIEKDGGFFGRGVADDKDEAAIYVANLIRMKQEGYVPRRSLVVALTTDEEGGGFNGVRYMLDKHPELLEAAFVFNEGGGGQLDETGRRMANTVQAAEKKFQNYTIVATNAGGHSSRPRPDNAIVELGKALQGITPTLLPVKLNAVTTEYLKRSADGRGGETGKAMAALAANPADAAALKVLEQDPALNAMIRSACVPTMIKGGHAQNALPQRAEATVNCRLVPDEDAKAVLGLITQATAGAKVTVTIDEERAASPASPIDGAVLATIDRVTQQMWKGVPVIPTMSTGATDSSPFREKGVPAYGVSGLFYGPESGAHGMNERVPVQSFYEGQEFLYRLAKEATVE